MLFCIDWARMRSMKLKRYCFVFMAMLCSFAFAEVDLISVFPDLDDDFSGSINFAYGYSQTQNSVSTDGTYAVANYALWNRTNGEVSANTKVSDSLYLRGDFSAVLLSEVADPFLRAMTYGVHMVSSKWGVVSLGRLAGPSLSMMTATQLESGVRSYFFEDAATALVIRKADKTSVGTVKDFISFGPIGGVGYRPMLRYILPTANIELSVAHALDYSDITEAGAKFIYDGSFARWVMMLSYANNMPGECVNPLGGDNGFTTACPIYQGSRYVETAGKLSLGYIDWVYNYAWLLSKINQPTIKEWFTGIDYTFLELSSYGPLTLGLGVTKRLLGVFNYQNDAVSTSATNGAVVGYTVAANKRLGRGGIRAYLERFQVSGTDTGGATYSFDTKPVYAAGVALYYDFTKQLSED